jgi:GNAT superfamily N-acetyltransferase
MNAQDTKAAVARPPTIRPVERADYTQWLPLWEGYNAFYGRSGPTALAQSITAVTWERFFDPQEPVHALVAADDSGLLGLAHYLFHRNTTQVELDCYLQDLFTVAHARGRGIARALIEAATAEARRGGACCLYWHTHESNATARRLYDRVAEHSGFILYSRDS